ncbi:MAG: hypothetical protein D4Q77_03490, partial [Methanothrix sp.]
MVIRREAIEERLKELDEVLQELANYRDLACLVLSEHHRAAARVRGEARKARAGAFGSGWRRRIGRGPGILAAGKDEAMGGSCGELERCTDEEGRRGGHGAFSCGLRMAWHFGCGGSSIRTAFARVYIPTCIHT